VLKFNKCVNGEVIQNTRTESVTATGDTIKDSENSAFKEATKLITNKPDEKIVFELQTIKIKYELFF
jgi:hypothetical protein